MQKFTQIEPESLLILPAHSQENGKDSKRAEGLVTSMVDALRLSKNITGILHFCS